MLGVLAAAGLGCMPSGADAQVVVYRVTFKELRGYNVDPFNGGYLVAPALGGAPSLTLTYRNFGVRTFTPGTAAGDYFIGLTRQGVLMSTFTAGAGDEGNASYMAFGPVNSSIRLKGPVFDLRLRVAKQLVGGTVAASSENGEGQSDSSIGFGYHAEMKMEIDGSLSARANEEGGAVEDGVAVVTAFLQRHGFRSDAAEEPEEPEEEE